MLLATSREFIRATPSHLRHEQALANKRGALYDFSMRNFGVKLSAVADEDITGTDTSAFVADKMQRTVLAQVKKRPDFSKASRALTMILQQPVMSSNRRVHIERLKNMTSNCIYCKIRFRVDEIGLGRGRFCSIFRLNSDF